MAPTLLKNHSSNRGDWEFPQIVAKFHITFADPKKYLNSGIQVWELWQRAKSNHLRHVYLHQPGIETWVPA